MKAKCAVWMTTITFAAAACSSAFDADGAALTIDWRDLEVWRAFMTNTIRHSGSVTLGPTRWRPASVPWPGGARPARFHRTPSCGVHR